MSVMEIGPGLGVVTQGLAAAGARVVAVEADRTLQPVLEKTLAGTDVEVVMQEFLKLDIPGFLRSRSSEKWVIVGNLPYYITTPIILKLLDARDLISDILIMVQREVAERMAASPGTGSYGSISVLIAYYFEQRSAMKVSRNVFYPVPDVDSEFIRLTPRSTPPVEVSDEGLLFRIVRAAFGKRRKTLLNALSSSAELGWDKDRVSHVLESAGMDPSRRGETLGLDDFAQLAHASGL